MTRQGRSVEDLCNNGHWAASLKKKYAGLSSVDPSGTEIAVASRHVAIL